MDRMRAATPESPKNRTWTPRWRKPKKTSRVAPIPVCGAGSGSGACSTGSPETTSTPKSTSDWSSGCTTTSCPTRITTAAYGVSTRTSRCSTSCPDGTWWKRALRSPTRTVCASPVSCLNSSRIACLTWVTSRTSASATTTRRTPRWASTMPAPISGNTTGPRRPIVGWPCRRNASGCRSTRSSRTRTADTIIGAPISTRCATRSARAT